MSRVRLIVMRVTDMHRVHPKMNSSYRCATCNEPVGVYPSGQEVLRRHPDAEIACNVCVMPHDIMRARPALGAREERHESIPVASA